MKLSVLFCLMSSKEDFLTYQRENPEEFSERLGGNTVISVGQFRNKQKYAMKWYKGRVYYDMSAMSKSAQSRILSALNKLESALGGSCITFQQRNEENKHIMSYIKVISGNGCNSDVGRQGYPQELSLGWGCLLETTIMHEFIHALGFAHEQSRSDRDRYVTINWANIKKGNEYNFDKEITDNQNLPYDYESLMHYGMYAFSKNGRPTITPKNPEGYKLIGHKKLTDKDIKMIRQAYNCKDECSDLYADCKKWTQGGQKCGGTFVRDNCKKSCNLCSGSGNNGGVIIQKPTTKPTEKPTPKTTAKPDTNCTNLRGSSCKNWTYLCTNPRYKASMIRDCKKTCGFCGL
ncbi:low choriolytic enzyme-like [Tubulanus polymorphus]|uniref:low choriolytic enzyme-like n=1 Tax=Tubulanus polymorphus TaxID=672921 RepID=UPI003DA417E1